jgi:hypothetical protein
MAILIHQLPEGTYQHSVLLLRPEDAAMLLAVLNRALNTWDPAERPEGALNMADTIEQLFPQA